MLCISTDNQSFFIPFFVSIYPFFYTTSVLINYIFLNKCLVSSENDKKKKKTGENF